MSIRTIKLKVLTSTNVVTISTDVRTFGEFKNLAEVESLGIDWKSAKLIDRATKASFELDDAVLPAVDCIMFHTPTKSKAGADWSQAGYKECKAEIKSLKDSGVYIPFNYTQATTKDLQSFLSDYYFNDSEDETVVVSDDTQEVDNSEILTLISTIQNLLQNLKSKVSAMVTVEECEGISEEDIVEDMLTVQDLEEEFDEIQKHLK